MIIQINTDHNISQNERMIAYFKTVIVDILKIYSEHITRIEVHFSDENGNKKGINDKKCLLEARLEGKQPMAVTSKANTIEEALNNALEKIEALLKTEMGQMKHHH